MELPGRGFAVTPFVTSLLGDCVGKEPVAQRFEQCVSCSSSGYHDLDVNDSRVRYKGRAGSWQGNGVG